MIFYKRTLKNVDDFQSLTEEQKEREIYLYKHKFLPWVIEDMLTKTTALRFLLFLDFICMACCGISYFLQIFYPMILVILVLPILVMWCVASWWFNKKINKKGNEDSKEKFIEEFEERISNIYLWNFKVISLRTWKSLKKYKWYYRYLRSSECNNKCYATTRRLASVMLDPKVKLVWLGAVGTREGHKFGHSVLKKGNWIYDSNLRRTYKAESYIKCFQAQIFKEFEMHEYINPEYMDKIWDSEFKIWCQEKDFKRSTEE